MRKKNIFTLDADLIDAIEKYAVEKNITKSEVAEEAFTQLFAADEKKKSGGDEVMPRTKGNAAADAAMEKQLLNIKRELYYVDHNVQVVQTMLDVYFMNQPGIVWKEETHPVTEMAHGFVQHKRDQNKKQKSGL